ncbi:hypothetical protein SYJ56_20550 [Algoriphagus sp. D3-2-R+10]|uniref:hypothetical protein n=1 Tax=Algoriphagus aurantiacus TaxID=3103948 RepID=UPI002B3F8D2B|nr:hypothetical protein [Algoriphagus sp. D3-2-R+10]MEB2777718.1 hypothetical protein [Algoriphagus sp. D3-2-R+10]
MKREIRYIELKSGFGDSGPAWIGLVEYSKSKHTVYFNDMALKKLKNPGISGNHFNIETGEEYWISGVKKNGQDRHWAGGGKIMIDEEIIDDYLKLVDFDIIENRYFDIVNINKEIDKTRFDKIENDKGEIPTL